MGAWHGRLPAWLRILVLAAAVTGLIGCARWAGEAYDGAVAYRRAPLCTGAPGPDCVARVTGTVIDTATGESCTTDSDGVRSCTPYYRLRVRYGDRTAWRDVGHGTYEDTHRGDPARLRTWHGAVVRLEVRGHTETYLSPADQSLALRLAATWPVFGVVLWAVVSGRLSGLIAFPNLGWLGLSLPVAGLVHGALFGASILEWVMTGMLAAFFTAWTAIGWRMEWRWRRW
ncbi:hypothetical protein [Streptomyces sennicomposti]|uniref:hypothetical protein n=1 Tax=Streptomyces sennicomposti TaxID=2873384 RepID=UPI001CA62472|nr:hypothetical protein [Streptomyces sennicomposti]MBY8867025.1 hypothetical protein [Streptomyces sennicomposti]